MKCDGCRFCRSVVVVIWLLIKDFVKMCGQVICLHSLLAPATNYSLKHRPKGRPFELPPYSYDVSRKSFVLRCLYEFK